MADKELQEILGKIDFFDKLYEAVRIVDPVSKKVLSYKNSELLDCEIKCFSLFGIDKVCDNCISIRAISENKPFFKLEYVQGKVYFVIALPYNVSDRTIAIELLCNATDSFVLDTNGNDKESELHELIANMNNLALKDPLTGMFNKRYLNEKLPIDMLNAKFSKKSISLILADIDLFKNINDTYGHVTGDEVLKHFAKVLQSCLKRETDWIARFGGEEFLICLPGANLDKALEIAELMRSRLESSKFECNGNEITVTSSFGVTNFIPSGKLAASSFIDEADKNLYKAKRNGRNRVEH